LLLKAALLSSGLSFCFSNFSLTRQFDAEAFPCAFTTSQQFDVAAIQKSRNIKVDSQLAKVVKAQGSAATAQTRPKFVVPEHEAVFYIANQVSDC